MTDQQISNHTNTTTLPKSFAPYVQPTKTYQAYVPSVVPVISPTALNKHIDSKNEQSKLSKVNSALSNAPTLISNNSNFLYQKAQNYAFKPSPTFIDRNHIGMKGSMMTPQSQFSGKASKIQSTSQFLSPSQGQANGMNLKKGRVTENNDMKFSSMQLGFEGVKVPSFLQNKDKKYQKSQLIKSLNNNKSEGEQIPLSRSIGLKNSKSLKSEQPLENGNAIIQQWGKSSADLQKEKLVKIQITINDFELIKELGTGKYGKVFLVREKKTNFICALKILEKSLIKEQEIIGQLTRELKIQSFLNHKNLIKMFGFFDDDKNIYLIMEAATGGQLFKHLKKHQSMPESKVASIMRQVCNAVNQLHSNRIIHRDIKPENIVLHDNVVKLCDFGWSVYCDSSLRTTFCGTPLYVGPEILKGKQYDQKIDIWSLGVMMYEMLIGQNPFQITKEEDLIKIIKEQIKIPSYIQISNEGRDFLFSCLKKNPQQRITIRELLNHDFFKKYPEKSDKKLGV